MVNGMSEDGIVVDEWEYGKIKGWEGLVWNCCFFFGGVGDGGGEGVGVLGIGNDGLLVVGVEGWGWGWGGVGGILVEW